jgi:hypothetical protein
MLLFSKYDRALLKGIVCFSLVGITVFAIGPTTLKAAGLGLMMFSLGMACSMLLFQSWYSGLKGKPNGKCPACDQPIYETKK